MEIEKPMFFRGTPGRLTNQKKRLYALALLKLRNAFIANGKEIPTKLSYQAIANRVGVYSGTTVRNWNLQDMTQDGISYRARLKAPDLKFTQQEEEILVGWIIYRDLTFLSTTTEKFRYFVYEHFAQDISPSYVSNFMKKWKLSLKLVGNAKREESFEREKVIQEAVDFLEGLENFMLQYNISSDRLFAIDKTYLLTSPWHKNVRHICPSGSIKSRKLTCNRGSGHEIWTTLRSDGGRGTFYVRTSEVKLANEQLVDGYISYVPVMKANKKKSFSWRTFDFNLFILYDSHFEGFQK